MNVPMAVFDTRERVNALGSDVAVSPREPGVAERQRMAKNGNEWHTSDLAALANVATNGTVWHGIVSAR
jgi:hypothetical protein